LSFPFCFVTMAESDSITIHVRTSKGDRFTIATTASHTVAALKAQIEEASSTKAEQQRLIFSGRVLKDADVLSAVGVKDGVTVHLVKGAAPSPASSAPAQPPAATPLAAPSATSAPPAAPINPFAAAFGGGGGAGAFGAGAFGGAGAGAGAQFPGLPPGMDMQQVFALMQNPAMQQMMQQMMANPQLMQAMIASNPMLQQMLAQNPAMANPAFLNQMFAGAGTTPAAGMGGAAPPVDIAALLQVAAFGGGGAGGGAGGADLNALLAALGGGAPASGPVRPPEERFADQLIQLGEMGFVDRDQALRALIASNGNVPSAVERLLSGL
jgi:ubiquilin